MTEPADPIARFNAALARAFDSEPDVPHAITLATVDAHGQPSARVVLLHRADEHGFVFFTNYASRKARDLEANPRAALCVHWKSLREQVRIEGRVAQVPEHESDAYFDNRPFFSQLAAMASKQSDTLPDRQLLQDRYEALSAEYGDDKPSRPSYWGGYRLVPHHIEFWLHRDHRLHHRVLYEHHGAEGWRTTLLYP